MSPTGVPGTTRRPATMGAKMTDAPMVATQPPSTAPHAVAAGRETTFEYATTPSYEHNWPFRGRVQACKSRAARRWGRLLGERCFRAGRAGQLWREVIGALPGQIEVRTAEMAVRRGLPVDRLTQLEALDDRPGSEVE